MKIFVINLDRTPERWSWMQAQAEQAGIEIVRLPAVDGCLLSESKIAELTGRPADTQQPLSRGEIGCVLSHRSAWEKIAHGLDPYGIVFEDDLHFGKEIAAFVRNDEWIPEGTDILRLETFGLPLQLSTRAEKIWHGRKLHRVIGPTVGAGAYIISRSFARRALEMSKPVELAADDLLFGRQAQHLAIRSLQLCPAVCIQGKVLDGIPSKLSSTLEDERLAHRQRSKSKGLRKLQREFTRLLDQTSLALKSASGRSQRVCPGFE